MRKVLILLVVVLVVMLAACGSSSSDSNNGSDSSNDGGSNNNTASPDLSISAIEVRPRNPTAGQFFTLTVYVANNGGAASGEYDVALYIEETSSGDFYPIGTFRQGPMQPGEDYPVYTNSDRLVNFAGNHRVHVEITPYEFSDGSRGNNSDTYDFLVN